MLRASSVVQKVAYPCVDHLLSSSLLPCAAVSSFATPPSGRCCSSSRSCGGQTFIMDGGATALLLARRYGSAMGRAGKAKCAGGAAKGKAKEDVTDGKAPASPPRAQRTLLSSRRKSTSSLPPHHFTADTQSERTEASLSSASYRREEAAVSTEEDARPYEEVHSLSSVRQKRTSPRALSSSGRARQLAATKAHDDAGETEAIDDDFENLKFSELPTEDPVGATGEDEFGGGGGDPKRAGGGRGGDRDTETRLDGAGEVEEEEGVSRQAQIRSIKASAVDIYVGDDCMSDPLSPSGGSDPDTADAAAIDEEVANRYLAIAFPELAAEYAAAGDSVNTTPVSEVLTDSAVVAGWRCAKCDQVWRSAVFVRCILKNGCPQCTANRTSTLAKVRPDLLQLWDYNRNNPFLKPQEIAADSKQSVFWNCPTCRESYAARVKDRAQDKVRCPSCALLHSQSAGELASEESVVLQEWHPLKNGDLRIEQVSPTDTRTKVWWLCAGCGHEWEASLATRLSRWRHRNKSLCPACQGKGVTELA
ncbi:hypothetical protein JKF63_00457 [Porcisia hertigi]|uniref:Treble clef zinc finger domain-containing protein n=1 Tax=Porcisia hertigi TaxID=2761500 RepID=A0A836HQ06_9TRYP|nr:hypothetical protein JKF63_00457 [Porcisia hertigi]